ncbi:MAG: hypothetical protein JXQ93_04805 [Flavobacteriaceae bacterium]
MRIKSSRNNRSAMLLIASALLVVVLGFVRFYNGGSGSVQIPEIERKTELEPIQITIKEKHYLKLKKKRNQALADGILETNDNDYIPGIITFNGEEYDADLRLKGDWTDHLNGDKWSYRIKLKNDRTILGMRKFSLHHPKTRGYINEWLYHKANKFEKLIGLRYYFVEGFLHIKMKGRNNFINKEVGIYAIEETFDKRTIESNKRKIGVILRISEKYFWKEVKQAWQIGAQTGYSPRPKRRPNFSGPWNEYITTFGVSNIMQDKLLGPQFVHAKNLLEEYRSYNLKVSEVFDSKKLAMYTALNNLFCAYHGLEAINLRFYYNPTTSKFEPIAYDGNSGYKLKQFHHYLYSKRNMDSEYRKELIKALEYVSKPEYLDRLFSLFYKEARGLETQLRPEFGKAALILKQNYAHNQTILRQELKNLKDEATKN